MCVEEIAFSVPCFWEHVDLVEQFSDYLDTLGKLQPI